MGSRDLTQRHVLWILAGWLGAVTVVGLDAFGALLRFRLPLGSPQLLGGAFALGVATWSVPAVALGFGFERLEWVLGKRLAAVRLPPPGTTLTALCLSLAQVALAVFVFRQADPTRFELTGPAWLLGSFVVFVAELAIVTAVWGLAKGYWANQLASLGEGYGQEGVAGALLAVAVALVVIVHCGPDATHSRRFAGYAGSASLVLCVVAARLALRRTKRVPPRLLPGIAVVTIAAALVAVRSPGARFFSVTRLPLTREGFELARALLDWDRDGSVAVWMGGADCAPSNPDVAPATREIRGDGVDQDCRGGDAPVAVAPPSPAPQPWAACLASLRRASRRPNVVYVTVDAMRRDTFLAQAPPRLLAFAEHCSQFERAYAPASRTNESVPALLDGTWPADLASSNLFRDPRQATARLLFDALRTVGYGVQAVSLIDRDYLGPVFDSFDGGSADPPAAGGGKFDFYAGALTHEAMRRLAHTQRPLFLWLHHADAHLPHVPIARDLLPEPDADDYSRSVRYALLRTTELTDFILRSERRADTIVVLSADHGEELGERGRTGHGSDLVEAVIRVPLLVYVPGCPAVDVGQPVSLAEIGPAIAELVGAGQASWSILDAIAARPRPFPVVAESFLNGRLERAVIHGSLKLRIDVATGGRVAFDLAEDPDEERDIYSRDAVARELESAYQRWLDRSPMWRPNPGVKPFAPSARQQ